MFTVSLVRRCYHGGRLKVVRTLGTRGCDGGCLGPRRTGGWFTWCNAQYTVQALYSTLYRIIKATSHLVTATLWQVTNENWSHLSLDFKSAENFYNWIDIFILRIWVFAHRQMWTCNNINIWQTKHFPLNFEKVIKLCLIPYAMNIFCGYKSILCI